MVTWRIEKDMFSDDVPCLVLLQFLYSKSLDGIIEYVYFRSNDLYKAYHSNLIGVVELSKMLFREFDLKIKRLVYLCPAVHVYEEDVQEIKRKWGDLE